MHYKIDYPSASVYNLNEYLPCILCSEDEWNELRYQYIDNMHNSFEFEVVLFSNTFKRDTGNDGSLDILLMCCRAIDQQFSSLDTLF